MESSAFLCSAIDAIAASEWGWFSFSSSTFILQVNVDAWSCCCWKTGENNVLLWTVLGGLPESNSSGRDRALRAKLTSDLFEDTWPFRFASTVTTGLTGGNCLILLFLIRLLMLLDFSIWWAFCFTFRTDTGTVTPAPSDFSSTILLRIFYNVKQNLISIQQTNFELETIRGTRS